ncbi:MAG: MarR family transcriptional regulator [Pseudomonadota bacterium]
MTDSSNQPPITLTPTMEKYVLHWGEMGTRWGTNRTVSQIHALLYLSPRPLNAEEIVQVLSVARSNVSTSIRELQSLGVVRVTHVLGDRRDYFESITDVWELFTVILDRRKQREINPTLSMLRDCALSMENDNDTHPVTRKRINEMLGFLERTSDWYDQMRSVPATKLKKLMKLGRRVAKFVTR